MDSSLTRIYYKRHYTNKQTPSVVYVATLLRWVLRSPSSHATTYSTCIVCNHGYNAIQAAHSVEPLCDTNHHQRPLYITLPTCGLFHMMTWTTCLNNKWLPLYVKSLLLTHTLSYTLLPTYACPLTDNNVISTRHSHMHKKSIVNSRVPCPMYPYPLLYGVKLVMMHASLLHPRHFPYQVCVLPPHLLRPQCNVLPMHLPSETTKRVFSTSRRNNYQVSSIHSPSLAKRTNESTPY